ncbi:MAG: hypothetical protein AB7G37_05515 [Solirubrobacteraceae bacterium]
MSAGPVTTRTVVRGLVGIVFVVLAACLIGWGAFHLARGPSQCGDGSACPPGFVPALLGVFAATFVVAPLGLVLATPVVRRAIATGLTLMLGAAAAGVLVARFGTDPVTDGTLGTWITTGVFASLGAMTLLAALAPDVTPAITRPTTDAPRPSTTGPRRPTSGASAPGVAALHAQLIHGLATGRMGQDDATDAGPTGEVARLLDLHRHGVIDDEALQTGLAALRGRGA